MEVNIGRQFTFPLVQTRASVPATISAPRAIFASTCQKTFSAARQGRVVDEKNRNISPVLACGELAAGLFGIIHDQISYSVSNEYFAFIQFRLLDMNLPDRFRAGVVGFLASWWMGIPLGILCGLAGFIQRSPSFMRRALIWSLPLIVAFTLAIALAGLAYGWCRTGTIDLPSYRGWFIPADINELRRFLCAGYMHNAAYLGGGLSVPATWLFHLIFRARNSKQPIPDATFHEHKSEHVEAQE
jgi:hypothetical protein